MVSRDRKREYHRSAVRHPSPSAWKASRQVHLAAYHAGVEPGSARTYLSVPVALRPAGCRRGMSRTLLVLS